MLQSCVEADLATRLEALESLTGVRRSVALAAAVDRLRAAGVASPEHDAAELLAHVHGLERRDLFRIDDRRR